MSVDTLTDSELRTKLMEYGYPVGPVTQTTRKILAKKLKNLIETRGGVGSRHSLAARYSSDDTDDDTNTSAVKKKKGSSNLRRQTLANPMPPPSPITSDTINTTKNLVKENLSPPPHSEFKDPAPAGVIASFECSPVVSTTRTTSKTIQNRFVKTQKASNISDGLDTGSDSDVMEDTASSFATRSKYLSNTNRLYDSHRILDRGPTYELDQMSKAKPIHMTTKDIKYNVNIMKPSMSTMQSLQDDISGRDSANQRDLLANYETPFLSEFTRRLSSRSLINTSPTPLSSLKSPTLRHTLPGLPEVKEKDSNGFSSLRTTYSTSQSPSTRHNASSSVDRVRDIISRSTYKPSTTNNREDVRNNQNIVSMILVAVLALFFGVLAIIYLGLGGKTDTLPSLSTDNNIPQCFSDGAPDLRTPRVNCVMKKNLESVLQLLRRLQPLLTRKAVSKICENSNEKAYLTDAEIVETFTSEKVSSLEVKEDLHNAQLLIIKNPKWGISLININDDNEATVEVLDTLDKLFSARPDGKIGMIILNPELPMQCLVKNKLFTIFSSLLIVAFGVLAVIGIQKLGLWYVKYKKSTEREVFKLVSEILNIVETHHQNASVQPGTQDSFLAINHVRDNLILPKDRKRMSGLWEKAVKFLDENESRIRKEVQQVAGEEFCVWRWLPNNSLNKSSVQSTTLSSKKPKVWQGQAFETMEGSVNSLTCSPTPCLKIRHMFDPEIETEDDWETKVQDAILEKCGESVKILHIRVDIASREGCVYMKCLSQEDAGKAYRALHGCWFDGNLVTVKYLRLERYHERFPDAARCVTPLKPSNNQRLSMQAHYWQSPAESN
ncbi:inner nuclear membrane protein Man1 isoform X2 [Harpegnathos saltator]|uniref:LEM domain-containing protein 2 n=1 Tax=Harpegnathos saltator TaxID=610380 RepID=E2BM28_HARSA|nr:inner nuclear membrane protein Man1 isoform X2 [Harpegnathos saltator]EFN83277.1 Inner nuclear membrane protein Man1 [Harpegnathos saltator]